MGRTTTLLIALLASACVTAAPKQHVFGALPLDPEGWYEDAFTAARTCVGLGRQPRDIEYSELEWFVVKHDAIPGIAGLYSPPRRIYLDEAFVMNDWVIYHEALHALVHTAAADNDTTFVRCIEAYDER